MAVAQGKLKGMAPFMAFLQHPSAMLDLDRGPLSLGCGEQ
jgi:hypothetical protein